MEQQTTRPAEEVTGKAVASLVFSLLGIAFWCPCIGSVVGVVLGAGEKSGVGRAGLILGWIGLGLCVLVGLVVALQLLLVGLIESM
ncbi:MAG: hypothetical protein AAF682_09200 [Planctomycetota bacterium]